MEKERANPTRLIDTCFRGEELNDLYTLHAELAFLVPEQFDTNAKWRGATR